MLMVAWNVAGGVEQRVQGGEDRYLHRYLDTVL